MSEVSKVRGVKAALTPELTGWLFTGRCAGRSGDVRLRPSLVCTAGCFPEQAAQGRGTCFSPKHWSRGGPKRRGEGCKDGKTFGSSRKTDMCWIYKTLR
ncbi:unnamed protein product [Merluccius merluccius]